MTCKPPEALKKIIAEVESFKAHDSQRLASRLKWSRQTAALRAAVPSATLSDDGETAYLGDLSPGCRACKAGSWDCIFATMRCNLECRFCLRPNGVALPSMHSALGNTPADLIGRYRKAGITGVSFSGGEPLLRVDDVIAWIREFKADEPDLYVWVYTNGELLADGHLEALAAAGLNELRFNPAAGGYRHLSPILRAASRLLPAVTIEIPAIPADAGVVLGSLKDWCDDGVKYLNLHELIFERGTNSWTMNGRRSLCTMPDGHACYYDDDSAGMIHAVMKYVAEHHLPLSVNECSLRSKACQLRGRRAMLAGLAPRAYERLRPDGLAECGCVAGEGYIEFIHPDALFDRCKLGNDAFALRLRRQPALDLQSPGQWVDLEWIAKAD